MSGSGSAILLEVARDLSRARVRGGFYQKTKEQASGWWWMSSFVCCYFQPSFFVSVAI
jgi:hypothetical protein